MLPTMELVTASQVRRRQRAVQDRLAQLRDEISVSIAACSVVGGPVVPRQEDKAEGETPEAATVVSELDSLLSEIYALCDPHKGELQEEKRNNDESIQHSVNLLAAQEACAGGLGGVRSWPCALRARCTPSVL